jgi:hypothetical protein
MNNGFTKSLLCKHRTGKLSSNKKCNRNGGKQSAEISHEPCEGSDIHDLNLGSRAFDFGDVKLGSGIPVCKPFSSRFGHDQPASRGQESLFINTFLL